MASSIVNSDLLCLKTEEQLNNIAGCLTPNENQGVSYAALNAIEGSATGVLNEFTKIGGARPGDDCPDKKLHVRFMAPECESTLEACDAITLDCSPVAKADPTYLTTDICIDECVGAQFEIDATKFECTCDDWLTEFNAKMRRAVLPMIRDYQRRLVNKIVGGIGTTFDGQFDATNPKPLKLYNAAGVPQAQGLFALSNEYEDQAPTCADAPFILSGSDKLRNLTCNAGLYAGNVDGLDFSKGCVDLSNVFYDRDVARTLQAAGTPGSEWAISWIRGAFDVLDWFVYDSELLSTAVGGRHVYAPVRSSGNILRQKIDVGTPLIGRPFVVDAFIYYDECEDKVYYKFKKYFDLWKIPQEAFCGTYNYCVLWDIVCADYDCADDCTPANLTTVGRDLPATA